MAHVRTYQGMTDPWDFPLVEADGSPVDLSGAATITLRLAPWASTTPKIDDGACSSPSAGIVRYEPTAADVDTVGRFRAFLVVVDGDGKKTPYPQAGGYLEVLIRAGLK